MSRVALLEPRVELAPADSHDEAQVTTPARVPVIEEDGRSNPGVPVIEEDGRSNMLDQRMKPPRVPIIERTGGPTWCVTTTQDNAAHGKSCESLSLWRPCRLVSGRQAGCGS